MEKPVMKAAASSGYGLTRTEREQADPELEALVRDIIGRVADKWTMVTLEPV